MLIYNDYIDAVKSINAHRKVKIEILDSNENVISTISPNLLDGSVQKQSDYCRRSASLTLSNEDGTLTPNIDLFWINSKLKLYTGYEINNEEYYVSQGIFLVGEPQLESKFSRQTLNLSLYDKMEGLSGLLGGTIESEYIIAVGTTIEDAVVQIFSDAGEIKTPIIYPNSEVTPYTITQSAGSSYLDILKTLADMISYTVYYDNLGYPHFEPAVNADTEPSSFDFTTTEVNYTGANRRFTYSDVKNYIIIYGENVNTGTIFKAIAQDNNVNSATSVARIGKKVMVIEDSNISSTPLANDRAEYELSKATQLIETVNSTAIIVDHLESENVVTITDSGIDLNQDRYLIKSISLPLVNSGEMSLELWKSRSFN